MHEKYTSATNRSKQLYRRGRRIMPAGVSYFIRYFEPYPFYVNWARGSEVRDVDGNTYTDFWMGHYTHILGHSPPEIIEAVKLQSDRGTHYGVCHELEITMAEQVTKMVPSAQMVRFTNSGTEAAMYATRVARAFTGRSKIVKFEGGWHGGYDALQVAVKPPLNLPESSGIPAETLKHTVVAPFNDFHETEHLIKGQGIGAIIVEPVLGAAGCISADREFLAGLAELSSQEGALLIFDEIITGFRLAPGGAQQMLGITPDVTILGKILGGGFPVGAVTGRRDIMERMNPLQFERPNFSFHGGTFTANPITLAAGLSMLRTLEDGVVISQLNQTGKKVERELNEIFENSEVDAQVNSAGSLFHVHFTREKVRSVTQAYHADRRRLAEYHMHLIDHGVFFLPTKTGAISRAHTVEDFDKLLTSTEDYARLVTSS